MKIDLSIIILSYGTKEITLECLTALYKSLQNQKSLNSQIIIVDNASTDGSAQAIQSFIDIRQKESILFTFIKNDENLGYPKANNQGLKKARGEFILFLNSDAIIQHVDFGNLLSYLNKNPNVGALTAKVILPGGDIDPASHRGFPTIWNSATYFLKMEQIFGRVPLMGRLFGGYHLTYKDLASLHEIDSPTGAFYLVKKHVLDRIGGFDEKNFFMYGEDLDLSFRIKKAGYKIMYYPDYRVLHMKYKSGLGTDSDEVRKKTKTHFYEAMKTFYRKHYEKNNSKFTNQLVYLFIDIKKKFS